MKKMKRYYKAITNNVCGTIYYQVAFMEELPGGGEHAVDWVNEDFETKAEAKAYAEELNKKCKQ